MMPAPSSERFTSNTCTPSPLISINCPAVSALHSITGMVNTGVTAWTARFIAVSCSKVCEISAFGCCNILLIEGGLHFDFSFIAKKGESLLQLLHARRIPLQYQGGAMRASLYSTGLQQSIGLPFCLPIVVPIGNAVI